MAATGWDVPNLTEALEHGAKISLIGHSRRVGRDERDRDMDGCACVFKTASGFPFQSRCKVRMAAEGGERGNMGTKSKVD